MNRFTLASFIGCTPNLVANVGGLDESGSMLLEDVNVLFEGCCSFWVRRRLLGESNDCLSEFDLPLFEKVDDELSQFTEIKRGDVHRHKDVCYSWRLGSNGNEVAEVAIFTAEIKWLGLSDGESLL